jgi:hypothetical protein
VTFPLIRYRPHKKWCINQFFCCVCIHSHGTVSTELSPGNVKGDTHTDTQTAKWSHKSTSLFTNYKGWLKIWLGLFDLWNLTWPEFSLDTFWQSVKEYPMISKMAVRILLPFSMMYLCEVEFSESQRGATKNQWSWNGSCVIYVSPYISLFCWQEQAKALHLTIKKCVERLIN